MTVSRHLGLGLKTRRVLSPELLVTCDATCYTYKLLVSTIKKKKKKEKNLQQGPEMHSGPCSST